MLERFIDKLRKTLSLVIRQRPSKPPNYNLGPRMRKALDALRRQKQFLVFRKADKGSVIIVENVEDYIRNGREHLADPQIYQRLDRDGRELAQAIKQAVKLRLRRLHNAGRLNEEQYKYCLPPPKVRPGRLYFLKKIHKRPHGIRPIVSSCANATENTSQFVDIGLNQCIADCNTTHESIKVTCVQSTTEVTFLDVTVFKGPKFHSIGCLDFKTHIKETNSRSYVHASSYHPTGTHKGIIVGEIHRYFRTNSGNCDFWKQM